MTMHRVIWRAINSHKFRVRGEGEEFVVSGTPVVTNFWFGTTVGMFYRTQHAFGYWQSSNVCNPVTAWRVAQLLPRLKTMRNESVGYDETMCGLVIAMNGDRHPDRMRNRATDFGMTEQELVKEIERLNGLWPSQNEFVEMWDALPSKFQDEFVPHVQAALDNGAIEESDQLFKRLSIAKLRLRTVQEQKEYEDTLIANGPKPEASLRQFLLDIGVTNLVYTLFDDFAPSHFTSDNLDREIMSELIGSTGFDGRIKLYTTAKQPDDPSAHEVAGGGGITIHSTNFGKSAHPYVYFGGALRDMVYVSWDHVTERYLLTLRPQGLSDSDDSRDMRISIVDLREVIGHESDHNGPLEPGMQAPWLREPNRGPIARFMRRR